MEAKNNILEKSTMERNDDTNPIQNYGPSDLDAIRNGELMYILVIILKVHIYWVIVIHTK